MRAPNSMSFLSKAYNFFKGKTSNNDENSYSKPQNSFQKPCFSPMQCKPMNRKEIPNISKRNRQVFDDVSNRGWSVASQGGQKPRRATLESLSQRSIVKNVWTSKGDKLVNNVAEQVTSSEKCHKQAEDDEEEGIFTVQLIKPHNGLLGIVLAGGIDTPLGHHFVHDVLPNSSASKSGRVRNGDELLQANGQLLTNKTHAEALSIFRSLPAVIELVVARTKSANRSILQCSSNGKKGNERVNKNIASPEKRRSIIEEAAKTSVILRSLPPVVDVPKRLAHTYVKPVKRVCRVSSFLGSDDDKIQLNAFDGNGEVLELKKEPANDGGEIKHKEIEKTESPSSSFARATSIWGERKTSDASARNSLPLRDGIFDMPQIHEDDAFHYPSIRRSRTLNINCKTQSAIEQCCTRATWPTLTKKQRLPLPWESIQPSTTATSSRSSSTRIRRNVTSSSASNLSLHRDSLARKPTGSHNIEKEIITVELERMSNKDKWGFTLGGGICSPYGDLPIFIAEISPSLSVRGLLQKGDEIVDFSGENFEGATCLEAEKVLRGCKREKVTVTIRRKFLQRSQIPQGNPYAEVWSSFATTQRKPSRKQRRRSNSMRNDRSNKVKR